MMQKTYENIINQHNPCKIWMVYTCLYHPSLESRGLQEASGRRAVWQGEMGKMGENREKLGNNPKHM
jgi:hypothetical protein